MNSIPHDCSASNLLIEPTHWPQLGLLNTMYKAVHTINKTTIQMWVQKKWKNLINPEGHCLHLNSTQPMAHCVCFVLNYIKHIGAASCQHTWFQRCERCQTWVETSSYVSQHWDSETSWVPPWETGGQSKQLRNAKFTVWLIPMCFVL